MDSAILSLLAAFLLSILGLFAFIWSLRKGLLVENPGAASVIFARGEVGRVDDPALPFEGRQSLQQAADTPASAATDAADLQDRVRADRSSAFPVFTSKRPPWSGHSITSPSSQPSLSSAKACVHTLSVA